MKKIISIILALMMTVSIVGCSSNVSNQDTEEELKAKIRAELEAEAENKATIDDMDKVYTFVNEQLPNTYSREDFNKWTANYLDISKDGNDDLAFTTTYFEGGLEQLIVITIEDNQYKLIKTDIRLAKYDNRIEEKDGFTVIYQKSGGSGMGTTYMDIYLYEKGELMSTLEESIVVEDYYGGPGTVSYDMKSAIEGSLTDFTYTANSIKIDENEKEKKETIKKQYTYDADTKMFNIKDLNDSVAKEPKKEVKAGLSYEVKNGSVYLSNNGNTAEVYNPIDTTIYKDDGAGEFTMRSGDSQDSTARSAALTADEKRLYMTINSDDDSNLFEYTLYYDLATAKVHYVGSGEFVKYVNEHPYTNYTIVERDFKGLKYIVYDSANQKVCELVSLDSNIVSQITAAIELQTSDTGVDRTLSAQGFTNETINGVAIDYANGVAVIIPIHETVNKSKLNLKTCKFVEDNELPPLQFTVLGTMDNVKITLYEGMGSEGVVKDLGTISNTYIHIFTHLPSDMSYIEVTGSVDLGEGNNESVEFTIDDMRDASEYVVLVY